MPYISQKSIQELNDRMDAVAIVSDYVKLDKKGGRFWACCPFHNEKTASFTVNPDLKSYYCFGCNKSGSIINFVMEMDTLTFPEAVELLAKKSSLELIYEKSEGHDSSLDNEKRKNRDELFELYHRISGTFQHILQNNAEAKDANDSLITRSISLEMINRFRLGFSPKDRSWIYNFLIKKGYSKEFLSSSGLFSANYKNISLFSGRLMFPISDRQGRTIAFGGRIIKDSPGSPKYINSPESEIYKKRDNLYGLDLALPEIKKTKTVYLAEGYMDVIALHQAGVENSVAPLGTAFTPDQAKVLKRWADKIIIFFDNDEAGQKAVLSAIQTVKPIGFSCYIVMPPNPAEEKNAKDPSDILQKFGPKALQNHSKSIIFDFEYLLLKAGILYKSGSNGQEYEGKVRALHFLFPYIDLLDSELTRNSCFEAAADSLGILPDAVLEEYRRYISGHKTETITRVKSNDSIQINDELSILLSVAVDYISNKREKIFPNFRKELEIAEIEDHNAKEIYIALEECVRYEEISMDDLLQRISTLELRRFFAEHSSTGEFSANLDKIVTDGIKKIKKKRLKKQQDEIIIKLRTAKKNEEDEPEIIIRELLSEKIRIDNELLKLDQGR